jgi:hypothetical protein
MDVEEKCEFVKSVAEATLEKEDWRAESCMHRDNMVFLIRKMKEIASDDWVKDVNFFYSIVMRDLHMSPMMCDSCNVNHAYHTYSQS